MLAHLFSDVFKAKTIRLKYFKIAIDLMHQKKLKYLLESYEKYDNIFQVIYFVNTPLNMKSRRIPTAFSLVEVIMALGVVTFGMIGLVGLLATGYGVLHKSMDTSTQAQIIQGISSEARMLDYGQLTNSSSAFRSGFPRYYTAEGQKISNQSEANYRVTLALKDSCLPGGSSSSVAQQLRILIANQRQTGARATNNVCIWVVNNSN